MSLMICFLDDTAVPPDPGHLGDVGEGVPGYDAHQHTVAGLGDGGPDQPPAWADFLKFC